MTIRFYVHQQVSGNVAEIELDRPEAFNAIDEYMSQKLFYVLEQWQQDSSIKLIIIRSSSEHFCAGADLKVLQQQSGVTAGSNEDYIYRQYQIIDMVRHSSIPVLVMASGNVMGFGAGLFMAAQYRVIAEHVTFQMPECSIGFFPDVGAAKFLTLFPAEIVTAMLESGHSISGGDLVNSDLINQVLALSDFASFVAMAIKNSGQLSFNNSLVASDAKTQIIRAPSPSSLAYSKLMMQLAADLSYKQLLEYEYALARFLVNSQEFNSGITAFFAKRAACWQQLPDNINLVHLTALKEQYGYFAK